LTSSIAFGVVQRATLRAKGLQPDVLVMTATPIPRTLALTAFGDMDVSVIRDLPPGRQQIVTLARPESRRDEVYSLVRRELEQGRQAYVIYPLVEESSRVDCAQPRRWRTTCRPTCFRNSRWRCCTAG
jgi:ATP-dependent DNA helicase RecG